MRLGTSTSSRRQHSGDLRAKVVVAAIKGDRTINEIASAYGVHPSQIVQWKKHALAGLPELLGDKRRTRQAKSHEELVAALYQQIGQLKVELDWIKKKAGVF